MKATTRKRQIIRVCHPDLGPGASCDLRAERHAATQHVNGLWEDAKSALDFYQPSDETDAPAQLTAPSAPLRLGFTPPSVPDSAQQGARLDAMGAIQLLELCCTRATLLYNETLQTYIGFAEYLTMCALTLALMGDPQHASVQEILWNYTLPRICHCAQHAPSYPSRARTRECSEVLECTFRCPIRPCNLYLARAVAHESATRGACAPALADARGAAGGGECTVVASVRDD